MLSFIVLDFFTSLYYFFQHDRLNSAGESVFIYIFPFYYTINVYLKISQFRKRWSRLSKSPLYILILNFTVASQCLKRIYAIVYHFFRLQSQEDKWSWIFRTRTTWQSRNMNWSINSFKMNNRFHFYSSYSLQSRRLT